MSRAAAPSWERVGDLGRLLEEGGAAALLRASGVPVRAAEVSYIRLKPGSEALVGLELSGDAGGGPVALAGYVRTHEGDRGRELCAKWERLHPAETPLGPGVRLLEGGRSVLFLFPNDARLRGLRFVAAMDKLKRELAPLEAALGPGFRIRGRKSRLTTVRYKPERRYIARADLELKNDATGEVARRSLFLREFPDGRGARLFRTVQALRAGAASAYVPAPLGSARHGRLYIEEAVPGEPLFPRVLGGEADPEPIAAMLAALHRTEVPGAPARGPREVLAVMRASAAALTTLGPEIGARTQLLEARLLELCPTGGARAFVHGDCHLHQVLVNDAGPVLVDFERSGIGHPLADLGSLLAHVEATALRARGEARALRDFGEAVVQSYARRTGAVDRAALAFFAGAALLDQALLPFRRQQPGWEPRVIEILDRALEEVGRRAARHPASPFLETVEAPAPDGLAWARFHPRPAGAWAGVLEGRDGARRHVLLDLEVRALRDAPPERDLELPALPRWLARGTLVAYRPGRRAVVKLEDGGAPAFAKVLRPARLRDARALHAALAGIAARAGRDFPRLGTASRVEDGALLLPALSGTPLHAILMDPEARRGPALVRAGAAIARFHGAGVEGVSLPERGAAGDPEPWLAVLREAEPEALAAYERAAARLRERNGTSGARRGLVHGDLHDKNVFLDDEGAGLIDLEGAGLGDAAEDLGNLAAHLVLRALQRGTPPAAGRADQARLLEGYAEGRGAPAPEVAGTAAASLFRLAVLYRFRRRFRALAPQLLEESLRRLDDAP